MTIYAPLVVATRGSSPHYYGAISTWGWTPQQCREFTWWDADRGLWPPAYIYVGITEIDIGEPSNEICNI